MRTEDGRIIYRCLNGEPEAFGLLVDKYKSGMYAYVYAKLLNFQDAQDVTQEVFLQAYRRLQTLRRWESFVFWLYRIAYNCCIKWLQTKSRRPDSDFIEDQDKEIMEATSIGSYRRNQADESLQEALESLPESYRHVLMLYYFGGMSSGEIARAIGVSPTAVRKRLSRGRAQLREEMVNVLGTAFKEQRLRSEFTFRIVEAVKRIRIHPMPKAAGLSLGFSLVTGAIIAILSFSTYTGILSPVFSVSGGLPSSSRMEALEDGQVPVEIFTNSQILLVSGRQETGETDASSDLIVQDTLFPAPQIQGNTWANRADMPTSRYGLAASSVNGKIYAIGGARFPGAQGVLPTVEEYDPVTNRWTEKAPMPTPRARLSTCVLDGKIYAIGGWPRHGSVEVYDPEENTWTQKARIPNVAERMAVAAVNGKIYAFGGWAVKYIKTAYEYDPVTDGWARKADLPEEVGDFSAEAVNGMIYLVSWLPTVLEYDPISDTYAEKAASPLKWWSALSTSVVDEKIYGIGGWGEEGKTIAAVYDPAIDKWAVIAGMPTERVYLATSPVGGKIYAIGGTPPLPNAGAGGGQPLSVVEEYDTGFSPKDVDSRRKLLTPWGEVKSD